MAASGDGLAIGTGKERLLFCSRQQYKSCEPLRASHVVGSCLVNGGVMGADGVHQDSMMQKVWGRKRSAAEIEEQR